MARKRTRARSTPTKLTPYKPTKKAGNLFNSSLELSTCLEYDDSRPLRSRKNIWQDQELVSLVEFILFYEREDTWPKHKNKKFWDACSEYISTRSACERRTGGACRKKVLSYLSKTWQTPLEAERCLLNLESDTIERNEMQSSYTCKSVQTDDMPSSLLCDIMAAQFDFLAQDAQLRLLSSLLVHHFSIHHKLIIHNDFVVHLIDGMKNLKNNNRSDIVSGLCRVLSTKNVCLNRMPFGMLEYTINFLKCDSLRQVPQCPDDYRLWLQTMYNLFGGKWRRLHCGPMWSVTTICQDSSSSNFDGRRTISEARVNIPGLSERTLQRDNASFGITLDASIQFCMLDMAAKAHPGSYWWIKGDGCDLIKGLCQSVSGVWSGDVDLDDGSLKKQYLDFCQRFAAVDKISMNTEDLKASLILERSQVTDDVTFLTKALEKANTLYYEKQKAEVSEKQLVDCCWVVKSLSDAVADGRSIVTEISSILDALDESQQSTNIPFRIREIVNRLKNFLKILTKHQRTPATHIFVFMISPEERIRKPYAIPIQCIPYTSLTVAQLRVLLNKVITEMHKRKMKIAGFCSNGEYNSMRSKGENRPVSIFQIRSVARKKFSNLGIKTMKEMLTPKVNESGEISAMNKESPVPLDVLCRIYDLLKQGFPFESIIDILRPLVVPQGYVWHTWKLGQTETFCMKMRSLLAQYEYRRRIIEWDGMGVPFRSHFYVPEINKITNEPFHDREDEGHMLKRMAEQVRKGGPKQLKLERYMEAVKDSSSSLTYTALSGKRKQSVECAERMFSRPLTDFMRRNNYTFEEKFISTVCGWREAHDKRGLTPLQRCRNNYVLLSLILDELMPWHNIQFDLSLLEVNKPIDNICGFTRETLIGLTSTIESREQRRWNHYENPRSSTTDDVECFFSVLRDSVGSHFTLKQVYNMVGEKVALSI